jgi:hypothetical protein
MNLFGVLKFKKMGEDFVLKSGLPFTIIRFGNTLPPLDVGNFDIYFRNCRRVLIFSARLYVLTCMFSDLLD